MKFLIADSSEARVSRAMREVSAEYAARNSSGKFCGQIDSVCCRVQESSLLVLKGVPIFFREEAQKYFGLKACTEDLNFYFELLLPVGSGGTWHSPHNHPNMLVHFLWVHQRICRLGGGRKPCDHTASHALEISFIVLWHVSQCYLVVSEGFVARNQALERN